MDNCQEILDRLAKTLTYRSSKVVHMQPTFFLLVPLLLYS
jgi:hypothetical protein